MSVSPAAVFDDASLRMASANPGIYERCDLRATDFYAAKLAGCRLVECDLTSADFSQATMTGATLGSIGLDRPPTSG